MLEEIKTTVANLDKWQAKIIKLRELEEQFEAAKKELYKFMEANDYSTFDTKLLSFTRVRPTTSKTEVCIEFDTEAFRKDHPMLYHKYTKTVEKVSKPRAGYLRMTLKGEEK